MKNLKHIKLFEAFDARTLNATLKHVKLSGDRKKFLDALNVVCKRFDIPESKLSDDLFTYLPFNRALRYNNVVEEEQICDARGEFIVGEKCDNGKVRRPWGRGFRVVDCGTCKGTGIKPKTSNLSMLKFWFDSDGKFIATTAVDGVYRETSAVNTAAFSPNIDDYDIIKRIPKTQIKNALDTGDIIAVDFLERRWNGETYTIETQVVAYVYKEVRHGQTKLFAIQNRRGRYPGPWNNDYRTIANASWTLIPSKCNNINLLTPKANTGLDPYGYNTSFDLSSFRIRPMQINSTVKDANFAIVLDFSKLENFDVKKKTEIVINRGEMRLGATALLSNVDIKNANIKRYFNKIAETFKVTGDLDDIVKFNRMASRLISRNGVYFLNASASDTITSGLANIATYMFKIIKKIKSAEREDAKLIEQGDVPSAVESLKSDEDFISNIDFLNNKYTYTLDWSLKSIEHTNKLLKSLRSKIETDSSDEWREKDLKVLANIDRLSLEMYKYIASIKVETLDDVEFLIQEIYSIRTLLRSERTSLSTLSNFLDRTRLGSYYSEVRYLYESLTSKRNYYGNVNNGIIVMINVIKRKQGQLAEVADNDEL